MWKASWLSLQRFGIFVLWHVKRRKERKEKTRYGPFKLMCAISVVSGTDSARYINNILYYITFWSYYDLTCLCAHVLAHLPASVLDMVCFVLTDIIYTYYFQSFQRNVMACVLFRLKRYSVVPTS